MLSSFLARVPQEMYRITLSHEGFLFTVSTNLYAYLVDMVRTFKRGEMDVFFDSIPLSLEHSTGKEVTFLISLPLITYPNRTHQKLNWRELKKASRTISFLLERCTFVGDSFDGKEFCLSNSEQLLSVLTGYSERNGGHSLVSLELALSETAYQVLVNNYTRDTSMSSVVQKMAETYYTLSSPRKKERDKWVAYEMRYQAGSSGCAAFIRNGGVPHFTVPGQCACLGQNPDEFKYSHELFPHNLDSVLQQITMLAGVVTFWNDILKPLISNQG